VAKHAMLCTMGMHELTTEHTGGGSSGSRGALRVLLLGGGGRDHALAWACARSPRCGELHAAPGNPGIARIATCYEHIAPNNVDALVATAISIQPDLVIIGAEDLLVDGVADRIRAAGIAVFGPSAGAARLEGSKAFAKELMRTAGVPTPRSLTCASPAEARAAIAKLGGAVAVKTDGLAAGCGAIVCRTAEHAEQAVHDLMERRIFGAAGDQVIVEELVAGHEISVMAITDGVHVVPLPAARDYKRLSDGDAGPNTGGMGAHAPSHDLDAARVADLARCTIQPIVDALAQRGTPFRGVIYAGVMLTDSGYQVLEYNARFGNPETQTLVRVIDADLLDLMARAASGSLVGTGPVAVRGHAVAVCVAAPSYPALQLEPVPVVVRGLDDAGAVPGVVCFYGLGSGASAYRTTDAGSSNELTTAEAGFMSAGGRVITVSAHAETMAEAIDRAYEAVDHIYVAGGHHRTDIGAVAMHTQELALR
jgi:phosphoribosylamine--glycine ligase